MKKAIVYFLLVIATGYHCRVRRCLIDLDSSNLFHQNLNVIRSSQLKDTIVFVEDYRAAIRFMGNITGNFGSAEYHHTVGYTDVSKFERDMRFWENWYKKNKCMLTKTFIDSAMLYK